MKMASTSIDLIRKKKKKIARAADFFVFRCRCFARLQCRFVRLKVMLHRTIRNDDFWRNTELQCWNNVVTIRNNVVTMSQRCVALKIVVANRLV